MEFFNLKKKYHILYVKCVFCILSYQLSYCCCSKNSFFTHSHFNWINNLKVKFPILFMKWVSVSSTYQLSYCCCSKKSLFTHSYIYRSLRCSQHHKRYWGLVFSYFLAAALYGKWRRGTCVPPPLAPLLHSSELGPRGTVVKSPAK